MSIRCLRWLMHCRISKLFEKMNTFACTHYIEEGCLALQQRSEYRTDKDLYHVIRLQRIIETIDTLANQSSSDACTQTAYLRTRSELEEFRIYLSSDSDGTDSRKSSTCLHPIRTTHAQPDFLFMQFHTAKLFLYQVAFFERSLQHNPALHLNTLREGLESAKAFLDLYLWLPPKSEMNLTNSEWIQLSFGISLAAKFAIVSRDPGVEPQTRELRLKLNMENVFRHLILRIGALVGRGGEGSKPRDIFAYYEQRVRKIQTWYERMLRATSTGSDSPPPNQQAGARQQSPGNLNQTPPQHQIIQNQTLPLPLPHTTSSSSPQPQQYSPLPQAAYSTQPTVAYSNGPAPTNSIPMASISPNTFTTGYSPPVPMIAFPDLMNAPGWDMPFSFPMEDTSWMFDPAVGYQGMGMEGSAGEAQWGSSSSSLNL